MEASPVNCPDTPTTSSLTQEVTASFVKANLLHAKGEDRFITLLYRKIEELEKDVVDLKTKKIIDETQMPPELLEQAGMLPSTRKRFKQGNGYRPLMQSEIEEAIKHSPFCSEQAKWLGIGIGAYKRYAVQYGLWRPNHNRKGVKKPWHPEKGRYPLSKILAGEMNGNPGVTDWMVRTKLMRAKTFPEKCAICGYNKRHLITGRPVLLVDHIDGDVHNYKQENIRLLCWNCTIECARGYIRRGIHKIAPGFFPTE